MRQWIFYPVLASAGLVLPVALVPAADAEDTKGFPTPAEIVEPAQPAEIVEQAQPADPEAAEPAEAAQPNETAADPQAQAPSTPDVSAAPAPEAPADEATAAAEESVSEATGAGDTMVEYVVREGDTLGDIARQHFGSVSAWRQIAELNGIDDPARLSVGTRLKLPAKADHGG